MKKKSWHPLNIANSEENPKKLKLHKTENIAFRRKSLLKLLLYERRTGRENDGIIAYCDASFDLEMNDYVC